MGSVAIFKGKLVKFLAKAGILVPARGDVDRSVTPTAGETAFNTDANKLEVYNGTDWEQLSPGLSFPSNNSTFSEVQTGFSYGTTNTAYGNDALYKVTGGYNVAIGSFAGENITNGNSNTFVGAFVGGNSNTSADNVIHPSASSNIAIGESAMYGHVGTGPTSTIDENTVIGTYAAIPSSPGFIFRRNVAIGYEALIETQGTATGNIAVGYRSGRQLAAGKSNNIAIGNNAFETSDGDFNIAIGNSSGISTTGNGNVLINGSTSGTVNNAIAIGGSTGARPIATKSNACVLGNSSSLYEFPGVVETIKIGQSTNNTSYVGLQSATTGAPVTWTLPVSNGNPGEVLTTNGSGTLSWSPASGGGSVSGSNITGPIYSRSATGTVTKIYGKLASDSVATRAISTWTSSSYVPTGINFNSICWSSELGIFAGVGSQGTFTRAATSTDGINWTIRTTPESNTFNSVCWSSELGIFCAVSSTGTNRVMTSPDGINWTARTASGSFSWKGVCWSPELGIFVAVSANPVPMYSSNGITWSSGTGMTTGIYSAVCWSPELGIFVAIGQGTVATSADGINWTEITLPANTISAISRGGVAWSAELGIFVAVSDAVTGLIATSTNGTTWTVRTPPAAVQWASVAWSPELGVFCATATSGTGTRIATSVNGINWTTRTNPTNLLWSAVCWSPELGIFCSVAATAGGGAMVSRDIGLYKERKVVPKYFYRTAQSSESNKVASTWKTRTSATMNSSDWSSSCWSPELGIFVAVASTTSGTARIATSIDGINWTERTSPAASAWTSVCWSPELNLFCAVADSASLTDAIMTSPDGINWTLRSRSTTNSLYSVCWSPDRSLFVAVGNNKIVTSSNGTTWTDVTSPAVRLWNSVCWSPERGLFVAVSTSTGTVVNIMTSVNGSSWTTQNGANTSSLFDVIWAAELNIFIATTDSPTANQLISSTDGTTWTAITIPSSPVGIQTYSPSTLDSLVYSAELKTIIGISSSLVITSIDGYNWVVKANIANSPIWSSLTWSPELSIFLALGQSNSGVDYVMTSRKSNILSEILNLKSSRLY